MRIAEAELGKQKELQKIVLAERESIRAQLTDAIKNLGRSEAKIEARSEQYNALKIELTNAANDLTTRGRALRELKAEHYRAA